MHGVSQTYPGLVHRTITELLKSLDFNRNNIGKKSGSKTLKKSSETLTDYHAKDCQTKVMGSQALPWEGHQWAMLKVHKSFNKHAWGDALNQYVVLQNITTLWDSISESVFWNHNNV